LRHEHEEIRAGAQAQEESKKEKSNQRCLYQRWLEAASDEAHMMLPGK
jgi:hypothetical protein